MTDLRVLISAICLAKQDATRMMTKKMIRLLSVKRGTFNVLNWSSASYVFCTLLSKIKFDAVSIRLTVSVGRFRSVFESLAKMELMCCEIFGNCFRAKFLMNLAANCFVDVLLTTVASLFVIILCPFTNCHRHSPSGLLSRHLDGDSLALLINVPVTFLRRG